MESVPQNELTPVVDVLRQQRNGRMLDELTEELAKLVEAVHRTEKVGSLTLTIKVKPIPGSYGEEVDVQDAIKTSVPQPTRMPTRMFVGADGRSLRFVPEQMKLRSADARDAEAKKEVRDVN